MKHHHLELDALRWLSWERKCVAVVAQRNIHHQLGNPDALGVTGGRYTVEVEIKRSMSDFRANAFKRHITNRQIYIHIWPRQFYFMVPRELADRVQPELPRWAGLLVSDFVGNAEVIVKAPVNLLARKVSLMEMRNMLRWMRNQIMVSEIKVYNNRQSQNWAWREIDQDYSI